MSRNAWADSDADLKAMERALHPPRSIKMAPLAVGLLTVVAVTFVLAYYVPLYRAQQTLLAEHGKLVDRVKTAEQSLAAAREQLQQATTERDRIKQELSQRDAAKPAPSKDDGGDVANALSASIEPLSKKGLAAIKTEQGRVRVILADTLVFLPNKLDVSRHARGTLCDIAKRSAGHAIRVGVAIDEHKAAGRALTRRHGPWAPSAEGAANVAELLADKCGVPPAQLSAAGLADASLGSDLKAKRAYLEIEIGPAQAAH